MELDSKRRKFVPFPTQNGKNVGLSSVLEADAREIAAVARDKFEQYGLIIRSLCFYFHVFEYINQFMKLKGITKKILSLQTRWVRYDQSNYNPAWTTLKPYLDPKK